MPASARLVLATVAASAAFVIGAAEALGRIGRPLQFNRETLLAWLDYAPYYWALMNGAALGAGFFTRIGFWSCYILPFTALLTGDALLGSAIFAAYGGVRAIALWATSCRLIS